MRKKTKSLLAFTLVASILSGCSASADMDVSEEAVVQETQSTDKSMTEEAVSEETTEDIVTSLPQIDNTKWQYNEEDGVYWQIGIQYCENPVNLSYETMGVFVPEAYLNATDNGDGTYTCTVNAEAELGGYTAETAPIVIPVNTPGYSAMAAPSDYESQAAQYTSAGFIYVAAGCRGRDDGAPAGVTDLKAAIRYIRYNDGVIPGSTERIFSFGMSGGGAQSALLGATGDSEMYTAYLEEIGAVMSVSDAVAGSMCWCPITNLDYADEAYEWNLGVTREGLDEEMQELSDNMAIAFAEYINEIGLKDAEGNVLVLTESESGIYQAGSYYDYIKEVIEESLNNFLADTQFPYSPSSAVSGGNGGMGRPEGMEMPEGERPDKADLQKNGTAMGEGKPEGEKGNMFGETDANGNMYNDGIERNQTNQTVDTAIYETPQDYVDSLNADGEWVQYDSATNTATITSVADFVKHCKNASKDVGAFDDLNETQGENTLFGYGDGEGAHFDAVMAELLADNETYADAYAEDLSKTDSQGNTVDYRLNMYNPLYFLDDYYEGYQTANVAKYWRIRTGINQGDTALSTEVNLALALENYGDTQVDFATVWGQGHTTAERTGDSTTNFISWVNECLATK